MVKYKSQQYLLHGDNLVFLDVINNGSVSLCYADCIYESLDFSWVGKCYEKLAPNGIIIIQTDYHTQHRYRVYMEDVIGAFLVNNMVWKNEWGNHPKNRFHQCYDDIIICSKGEDYKFFPEKVQVPKATVSKGLNPSGRLTKTATAWIDDITLTTTAKERIKKPDGHLLRWQKPLKLYDRIIAPFTEKFDTILDPFMGGGSLAKWCKNNEMSYYGMEIDEEVYKLAVENFNKV
jgi:DNA modification methylase